MNPNYDLNDRKDFLINMYNQLCSEIDRHINVIWQIVGVVLSTFAVYALVEKGIVPLDIATVVMLAVCGLGIGIVIESNYWYNRNLVIIANIERQFLLDSDQTDIQHYFARHRKDNAYLDMMKMQIFFVSGLAIVALLYHFSQRVLPNIGENWSEFELARSLPYATSLIALIAIIRFHFSRKKNYNSFKSTSPGMTITNLVNVTSGTDHIT